MDDQIMLGDGIFPSVCPLDCPDACSLDVTVAAGKIVDVRGSHANSVTAGRICTKVRRSFPSIVHGDLRLMTPLRRVGAKGEGRFERCSWDDALRLIAERTRAEIGRYGTECVLPLNYAGPMGALMGASMDRRFFHALGATRLDRAPMCAGTRSLAHRSLYGGVPQQSFMAAALADHIILWGTNASVSNLHLMRVLKDARRNGAKIVVIDPRRTKVAAMADQHIMLKPGTDVVLAYALAAELDRIGAIDRDAVGAITIGFDDYMAEARKFPVEEAAGICGVTGDDIRTLASDYAAAPIAGIAQGVGPERNYNGGAAQRTAMALPTLAGKFGVPGGGIYGFTGARFPGNDAALEREDLLPFDTRTFNILEVGAKLNDPSLDPPVQIVFIYNHNPLMVHPDQNAMRQGLARDDLFVVGIECSMTDSMAYADIILPATTHFEYADFYTSYGHDIFQKSQPVIPPVGEAQPNTEIFRRLAAALGLEDPAFHADDETLMDEFLGAGAAETEGVSGSRLPGGYTKSMAMDDGGPLLFRDIEPQTPSGKVELYSADLDEAYGQGLPRYRPARATYPLTLISAASPARTNSSFGGEAMSDGIVTLDISHEDAAARGILDGADVRLFNDMGEVNLIASVTDRVGPGVLSADKGAWMRSSRTGMTLNALMPSALADIAGGCTFYDCFCEVEPWTGRA